LADVFFAALLADIFTAFVAAFFTAAFLADYFAVVRPPAFVPPKTCSQPEEY